MKEKWGLKAHQQTSPALEEKLAFTATLAGSYEDAAQLAGQWGCPVDDSGIHRVVQQLGQKSEAHTQTRLKQVPQESQPQKAAAELAIFDDRWVDGPFSRFGLGKEENPERARGIIKRSQPMTGPLEAARSNRRAAKASADSNALGNSGRSAAFVT